jgi:hypothetical protein
MRDVLVWAISFVVSVVLIQSAVDALYAPAADLQAIEAISDTET